MYTFFSHGPCRTFRRMLWIVGKFQTKKDVKQYKRERATVVKVSMNSGLPKSFFIKIGARNYLKNYLSVFLLFSAR